MYSTTYVKSVLNVSMNNMLHSSNLICPFYDLGIFLTIS